MLDNTKSKTNVGTLVDLIVDEAELIEEDKARLDAIIKILMIKFSKKPLVDSIPTLIPKLRYRQYHRYNLFVIDEKVQDCLPIYKWECSTFIEQLLNYFDVKFPAQKKNERLETLAILLDLPSKAHFYSDQTRSSAGTCSTKAFLTYVGFILYHEFQSYCTRKNTRVALLYEIGSQAFEIIMNELDVPED